MKNEIKITRNYYDFAYLEGESAHTADLGDIIIRKSYVRIPVTVRAIKELHEMAELNADGLDSWMPRERAIMAYARKLVAMIEDEYGELLGATDKVEYEPTEDDLAELRAAKAQLDNADIFGSGLGVYMAHVRHDAIRKKLGLSCWCTNAPRNDPPGIYDEPSNIDLLPDRESTT